MVCTRRASIRMPSAAFQEFLKKFPDSVYVPNAHYEMGAAYFVLNDYKNALGSYQVLVEQIWIQPEGARGHVRHCRLPART